MNIKQICSQAWETIDRLDIELLLAHALNQPRAYLYAHPEKKLTAKEFELFESLLLRREQGEPVAYILGEAEFYSLRFIVTPDVLIPRPETELLVSYVLEKFKQKELSILELGTGSGVISVAIAKNRPNWAITATDISEAALAVARQNALYHKIATVRFLRSDWFSELAKETYDVIISNPPYIADEDTHLKALSFEPQLALRSGEQGMDAIRKIIGDAKSYLKPNGLILFEHGYEQALLVQKCFVENQFSDVKTEKDLSGHPRVTIAKNA